MTPAPADRRAPYVDAAIAELEYRACRYVRALDALAGAIATAADVEAELVYRPFFRVAPRSYRAFAVCARCGAAQEF
jgi:hypothetical protein